MPDTGSIKEITGGVKVWEVGDRLHFELVSGDSRQVYSISFHKAGNACHLTSRALEKVRAREAATVAALRPGDTADKSDRRRQR